jgi:adenylate cyclase
LGWIFGSIEILFLNKLFVKRSFGIKILIKTIIYIIILCVFLISLAIIINSISRNVLLFDPIVLDSVAIFFTTFSFWVVIIYISAVIGIMLFFSEVSDNLGQGVLNNFLIGKYHKPREEERIFMFLDMKSSTTIAEKLGHIAYYKLLNDYYADITDAIIQTSGEIYQYVGDEIVVS